MSFFRGRVVAGIAVTVLLGLPAWAAGGPTISIAVDASEAPRKIIHAKLRIPASAGTLTLYYPKWIPGEHAPDGPVNDLTGLKFSAAGKALKWRRDLLDGWTINVEVPAGQNEVLADLDYLEPATLVGGFSAGSSATDKLLILSWNQVVLYPKGFKSDDISYSASLKIPEGWKYATSLFRQQREWKRPALQSGLIDDAGRFSSAYGAVSEKCSAHVRPGAVRRTGCCRRQRSRS